MHRSLLLSHSLYPSFPLISLSVRGNKGTIFVLKKADVTTDPIAAFATKKNLNDNNPSLPSSSANNDGEV